jgi:hypothetical protein
MEKFVVYGHSIQLMEALGPGECDACFADYKQGDAIFAISEPEALEVISVGCSPMCASELLALLILPGL